MAKAKIVFMGTPEFAVTILDGLISANFDVVGVVTVADKRSGRGQRINQSAVKKYAVSNGLKVLQPTNLKDEHFINGLKALEANLFIVVAFRMLPKVVWSLPSYGTFNLHASLLPAYRGAAPINWAIINGEEKTGVTTFFIDDKIDTGEIILQSEIVISKDENVGELHDRLMHLGSELVVETVKKIEKGNVDTYKQPDEELKFAPKIFPSTCKIDWSDSIHNVYNKIRGLNPYPTAWTNLEHGQELISIKIYKVKKEVVNHNFDFGSIHTAKSELKVAANGGFIIIEELKMAGKRKMDAKNFLNGFTFDINSKMC